MFSRIDSIKEQLDQRRPLTAGELQRLQDEFLVEYTYNSNAIEGNTLTLQKTALVIKQNHTPVLMDRPEDRGIYRRIPVRIMRAYHTPPEPVLVPDQMENLIKEFAKKKLHPIESAALFHLKFEGIHSFVDGNGRTGRLILNLFLMRNGYPRSM